MIARAVPCWVDEARGSFAAENARDQSTYPHAGILRRFSVESQAQGHELAHDQAATCFNLRAHLGLVMAYARPI